MPSPPLFSTGKQTPLAAIASHQLAHLPPQSSLLEAVRLLARRRISSLLVLDNEGHPLGILSEQHILAALHAATPPHTPISAVMAPPVTVPATIGCAEAYQRCLRQGVQHLVLIDNQQRAVAVVSDTDYRRHLDLQAPEGQTRIGAIMSRGMAVLPPETPLRTALAQMHTRMCGVVVVVDDDQVPVGILAQRDLARLYLDDQPGDERCLADVMTSPVVPLPLNTTLAEAAAAMLDRQVRQFPVVDESGALVGLIAARELTQAMAFGLMEQSLAREQSQLQQLLEQAPFPLVITRLDSGLICYLNQRAEHQFQLSREQLIGQPAARFYQHPEDRAPLLAQLQQQGQVFDQELTLVDIHGHPYTALVSLSLAEFEQQPAILTAINDITERKQFEQDLVFRNILLSTQQEASIDGILVVDEHNQVLSHNHRFAEMWRVPEAILHNPTDSALLSFVAAQLQDPPTFVAQVRAIYGERHLTSRQTILLADGRIFDRYTAPLTDDKQRYLGRIWFFRDITEQQQATRQLQEERAKLQGLFQAIPDLLWLKNPQGRYLLCNPMFERFFGAKEADIVGKTDDDFVSKEEAEAFRANDRRAIAAAGPVTNEEWLCFADGSGFRGLFEAIKTPLHNKDGSLMGVLGIARDITQRRREQRDLRERIKEQRCLYRIFALTEDVSAPFTEQLQQVVTEIAPGWQYAEITQACIEIDTAVYATPGFQESPWMLVVVATSAQGSNLRLTIAYQQERPLEGEGPFLSEERSLAEAILHRLVEVAERRHSLAAIEARDRLIATMFAQTTDAIVLVEAQTNQIVDFNTAAHAGLGYSSEEFARLRITDFQAEHSAEAIANNSRSAQLHGEVVVETRHRHKNGTLRDVALTLRPIALGENSLISAVWRDITEQKARERALAESEKRLKTITDSALDGILMLDACGCICYWNPAAEAIFGYQAKEVMGKDLHQLLAPARYHEMHTVAFDHFLKNGEGSAIGKTLELHALRHDGSEITIALSLSSVHLNGQWHAVGIVRDISELKANQAVMASALEEAETANRATNEVLAHLEEMVRLRTAELELVNEQLRISEERYIQAMAATTDGLWDWNMVSGELYCNPAYYRMLGYEPGELNATMVASGVQLVHAEDREMVAAAMRQLLAESGSVELEYRMLTKAGDFIWVLSRSKVVARDGDGRPLRTVGVHTDLTVRKQIELELRTADAEQQAIFNTVGMGIFLVKNRSIIRCNRRLEQLFGYDAQELIGGTTECWYQTRVDYLHWGETIAEALRTKGIFQAELQLRRKDGRPFWARTTAQALDRKDISKGIVGLLDDITQERQVSEALRHAKEAAEAATRAKSEFLANMSHEIRTPLNAILGFAHLLKRDPLTQQQKAQLDKLADASRHLLHVINDILDISKIEANKMAIDLDDFEPARVIDQVCSIVSDRVSAKNLQLKLDTAGIPLMVRGDGPRLGQILLNLVGNAVKFTEQGQVVLAAKVIDQQPERVLLRFTVTDTGIGMSQEQVARMFHAFEQADTSTTRRFGGTGLGLAISKRLVELMGGRIGVESQLGAGTTFCLELPFVPSMKTPKVRLRGEALRGKRALVIDDSLESQEIMASMLEEIGLQVGLAASGEEGLDAVLAADQAGQPFALLVVDWRLGGIDGLTTLERLPSLALNLRPALLMVTAYSDDLPRNQATRAGISRVITKPVTPSMLFDAIVETMLPAIPGQEPGHDKEQALRERSGARILVVEDNPVNQEVALMLLESMGITVSVADNGQVAVERVQREPFDLVFMDVQMPVMDGLEATAAIRRLPDRQSLPILAMTANAFSEDRQQCLDAGMNDHIAKPIELTKLQDLLLKWLPLRPQSPIIASGGEINAIGDIDGLRRLDGVDIEAGLRLLQGDAPGYLRLLLQFAELHGADADLFSSLAANNDYTGLRQRGHALKGAASTLGAWKIAGLAAEIEQMAATDAISGTAQALLEKTEALRPLLSQLRTNIAAAQPAPTSTAPQPYNHEQLSGLLSRMEQLLAIEDSAINDLYLSHCELLNAAFAAQAPRLGRLIDAFDYGEALSLVRSLLATQAH